MGCRGTACLTMVLITGCRRKIFAPVPGTPPPPPASSLAFVSVDSCFSHVFLLLSPAVIGEV